MNKVQASTDATIFKGKRLQGEIKSGKSPMMAIFHYKINKWNKTYCNVISFLTTSVTNIPTSVV
jgi:hypothetical protein